MKLLTLKIFFVFAYLISSTVSYSIEHPNIKNLAIHKKPKKLNNVEFQNSSNLNINLQIYKNELVLLNFWATWCAPCVDEMPSLNELQKNSSFKNLKIIPINVGKENLSKAINFYKRLEINNLEVYIDKSQKLARIFSLRGIPTTVLINKEGNEFARIVGPIDFQDEKFIEWLKNFD